MTTQLKQQTFSKPIVYGTISYSLGANKKQTDKNTHRWCAYVRGPNNEDLSTFIDKVVFVLHETFPDHQRAISKPPFEVVEKGWGEFDILIQIHFKTHYPQLELVHKLKFYGAKSGGNSQSTKKPVVSEFYDEIVFVNPSLEFYDLLRVEKYLQNEEKPLKEIKPEGETTQMEEEQPAAEKEEEQEYYDWKQHYLKFDAQDHKQKLEDALVVIKEQNEKTKIEQEKCEKDIETLNKEIEQLQKEYDQRQKKLQEEQQQQQSSQPPNSSSSLPQQQPPQDNNASYTYPTPSFQNSQSQSQINDYPINSDQMRSPLPPTNMSSSNIPLQNVSHPPPPPPIGNQYNPSGQYPMNQSMAGGPGPQQQGPPPPHMMQGSYGGQNPNMKMNNPYQQGPPPPQNMPM